MSDRKVRKGPKMICPAGKINWFPGLFPRQGEGMCTWGNNQIHICRYIIQATVQRMNWRREWLKVKKWIIKLMQYRP